MTILITNDDGIHSDGLLALKHALQELGRVVVVAPDRPRSASGHSITLHKPLRIEEVRLADGDLGYASNGTPSDCISLGILDVAGGPVDLVVSGINRGPNLGWDLTYSGTVSAAMEGAVMGVRSFAISVAGDGEAMPDAKAAQPLQETNHGTLAYAASLAVFLARRLIENGLPEGVLLNVNVPGIPPERIAGIEVTRQGKRHYEGQIVKRVDPMGRAYYWLGGDAPLDELEEGTDVKAIADNKVSVTPIHLDLTGYPAIEVVKGWNIERFSHERRAAE